MQKEQIYIDTITQRNVSLALTFNRKLEARENKGTFKLINCVYITPVHEEHENLSCLSRTNFIVLLLILTSHVPSSRYTRTWLEFPKRKVVQTDEEVHLTKKIISFTFV